MINKLAELKRILQPADIILTHGDSFISKTIQKVTNSYWNHAVMYIGNSQIIEADWGGVAITSIKRLREKPIKILRHKEVQKEDLEKLVNYAVEEHLGADYDFSQIAQLFWFYATGRRGDATEVGVKNRFICSELVGETYFKNGYVIALHMHPSWISPEIIDRSDRLRIVYESNRNV